MKFREINETIDLKKQKINKNFKICNHDYDDNNDQNDNFIYVLWFSQFQLNFKKLGKIKIPREKLMKAFVKLIMREENLKRLDPTL